MFRCYAESECLNWVAHPRSWAIGSSTREAQRLYDLVAGRHDAWTFMFTGPLELSGHLPQRPPEAAPLMVCLAASGWYSSVFPIGEGVTKTRRMCVWVSFLPVLVFCPSEPTRAAITRKLFPLAPQLPQPRPELLGLIPCSAFHRVRRFCFASADRDLDVVSVGAARPAFDAPRSALREATLPSPATTVARSGRVF